MIVSYMNTYLADICTSSSFPIDPDNDDIFTAIRDGCILADLFVFTARNLGIEELPEFRSIAKCMTAATKKKPNVFQADQNIKLCLDAAKHLRVLLVNVGPSDFVQGVPHLILGVLWQVIRVNIVHKIHAIITSKAAPAGAQLSAQWSTLSAAALGAPGAQGAPGVPQALAADKPLAVEENPVDIENMLICWLNDVVQRLVDKQICNLGQDLKGLVPFCHLLQSICLGHGISIAEIVIEIGLKQFLLTNPAGQLILDPLGLTVEQRAALLVAVGKRIAGSAINIRAEDLLLNNAKVNFAFLAEIFSAATALPSAGPELGPGAGAGTALTTGQGAGAAAAGVADDREESSDWARDMAEGAPPDTVPAREYTVGFYLGRLAASVATLVGQFAAVPEEDSNETMLQTRQRLQMHQDTLESFNYNSLFLYMSQEPRLRVPRVPPPADAAAAPFADAYTAVALQLTRFYHNPTLVEMLARSLPVMSAILDTVTEYLLQCFSEGDSAADTTVVLRSMLDAVANVLALVSFCTCPLCTLRTILGDLSARLSNTVAARRREEESAQLLEKFSAVFAAQKHRPGGSSTSSTPRLEQRAQAPGQASGPAQGRDWRCIHCQESLLESLPKAVATSFVRAVSDSMFKLLSVYDCFDSDRAITRCIRLSLCVFPEDVREFSERLYRNYFNKVVHIFYDVICPGMPTPAIRHLDTPKSHTSSRRSLHSASPEGSELSDAGRTPRARRGLKVFRDRLMRKRTPVLKKASVASTPQTDSAEQGAAPPPDEDCLPPESISDTPHFGILRQFVDMHEFGSGGRSARDTLALPSCATTAAGQGFVKCVCIDVPSASQRLVLSDYLADEDAGLGRKSSASSTDVTNSVIVQLNIDSVLRHLDSFHQTLLRRGSGAPGASGERPATAVLRATVYSAETELLAKLLHSASVRVVRFVQANRSQVRPLDYSGALATIRGAPDNQLLASEDAMAAFVGTALALFRGFTYDRLLAEELAEALKVFLSLVPGPVLAAVLQRAQPGCFVCRQLERAVRAKSGYEVRMYLSLLRCLSPFVLSGRDGVKARVRDTLHAVLNQRVCLPAAARRSALNLCVSLGAVDPGYLFNSGLMLSGLQCATDLADILSAFPSVCRLVVSLAHNDTTFLEVADSVWSLLYRLYSDYHGSARYMAEWLAVVSQIGESAIVLYALDTNEDLTGLLIELFNEHIHEDQFVLLVLDLLVLLSEKISLSSQTIGTLNSYKPVCRGHDLIEAKLALLSSCSPVPAAEK